LFQSSHNALGRLLSCPTSSISDLLWESVSLSGDWNKAHEIISCGDVQSPSYSVLWELKALCGDWNKVHQMISCGDLKRCVMIEIRSLRLFPSGFKALCGDWKKVPQIISCEDLKHCVVIEIRPLTQCFKSPHERICGTLFQSPHNALSLNKWWSEGPYFNHHTMF